MPPSTRALMSRLFASKYGVPLVTLENAGSNSKPVSSYQSQTSSVVLPSPWSKIMVTSLWPSPSRSSNDVLR